MKKRELLYLSVLLIVLLAVLFLFFPINGTFFHSRVTIEEKPSEDFFSAVVPEKAVNPGPLRFLGNSFFSNLTKEGVLTFTNEERTKNGIPPLIFDEKLNSAALHKVNDMFSKQYFAHVSPQGISASDLAHDARYEFIVIGENLALGNFKDEKELVDAWMASPGHRVNILTRRYEDIGIAVKSGEFEGKTVWLAVETFGTPASSCGLVDISLKKNIDENKEELSDLEFDLGAINAKIEATQSKTGREYNLMLEEYNLLVNEYNPLVNNTKELVAKYNAEVEAYNACAQGS